MVPLKLRSFVICLTQAGTRGSLSPLGAAREVERTPQLAARQEGGRGGGKQRQAREASLTVKEPVGKGTSAGECRNKLPVHLTASPAD